MTPTHTHDCAVHHCEDDEHQQAARAARAAATLTIARPDVCDACPEPLMPGEPLVLTQDGALHRTCWTATAGGRGRT